MFTKEPLSLRGKLLAQLVHDFSGTILFCQGNKLTHYFQEHQFEEAALRPVRQSAVHWRINGNSTKPYTINLSRIFMECDQV